ncbi:hypothetical protein [Chryseobacterium wanjuense]
MDEIEKLAFALNHFAGLTEEDFKLSEDFWLPKNYNKGDFYNLRGTVCTYLGFIVDGVFRSYSIDEKTGDEKMFFCILRMALWFLLKVLSIRFLVIIILRL